TDFVGIPEVFKNEPPVVGLFVVFGLETSRENPWRRQGCNVAIEGDFLMSAALAFRQTLRKPCLHDETDGRVSDEPFIGQPNSHHARQDRRPRAFYGDARYSSVVQR